jgi:hypothetical protein
MISLCVNFGMIPCMIDFTALIEDYRRKSSLQISIMRKIFFFMFINTLILPLLSNISAIEFFKKLIQSSVIEWPTLISINLMMQQYYYIKFIIQLTFISNGFWLVDFFHRGQTWLLMKLHERKESDSEVKTPFRDDYQFDLGYHQSYSIVVMLNCLLFCPLVPLISFFAFFFFFIKYHVDKYNLVFVYFKIYESGGKIRKNVTNFMLFTLIFI